MSTLDPAVTPRPTVRRPARALRIVGIAALSALGLALIGGGGAAAAIWHHQQDDLAGARADRAAAAHTLDGALARAVADGVAQAQLASLVEQERHILAQPALPSRLRLFDGGETGHLHAQAADLRALLGRLDAVEASATALERKGLTDLLARYDAAVTAAQAAGVDVSGDQAYDQGVRVAVAQATTPKAVDDAVSQVNARIADLAARVSTKKATDAAAVAFAASHAAAQSAVDRATALLAQAQQYPQLQIQQWVPTIQAQQQALTQATTREAFDAVTAAISPAANGLGLLLEWRANTYQDMADARQIVQEAIAAKVDPGDVPATLDRLQPMLDSAGIVDAFAAITTGIDAAKNPLEDKVVMATLGVGKVIFISLAQQHLTAYQDGATIVSTPVTTGRPALPTPPGNYTVLRKNHPWTMHSDFPPSSPYWYPDSEVQYVLWFRNDGYGIHDAPWRSTYGPGTEASGSHGCVNVPYDAEVTLYNWAPIGTRVVIR